MSALNAFDALRAVAAVSGQFLLDDNADLEDLFERGILVAGRDFTGEGTTDLTTDGIKQVQALLIACEPAEQRHVEQRASGERETADEGQIERIARAIFEADSGLRGRTRHGDLPGKPFPWESVPPEPRLRYKMQARAVLTALGLHGLNPDTAEQRHVEQQAASRNEVKDEDFDGFGRLPGHKSFNAPPPAGYEGRIVCFEVLRLGDHAHMEVSTGRQHANGPNRDPTYHKGGAGHLVFAWEDWLHFRDALDAIPWVFLAEVENPTPEQLDRYTANPESRAAIAEQQQAKLRETRSVLGRLTGLGEEVLSGWKAGKSLEFGPMSELNDAIAAARAALAATTEDPR